MKKNACTQSKLRLITETVVGKTKNRIKPITRELTFDEWEDLSYESKRDIWNHHWNPYELKYGKETRISIVNAFADNLKIEFQQIGIGYFGWGVWMLFVIVDNSRIRIPKEFASIPVNKGIIIENLNDNVARVKYGYGGTVELDLTEKLKIR